MREDPSKIEILETLGAKFSQSEENGIALLKNTDQIVFCPGISTGGFAEIRMAQLQSERQIIATTIDKEGIDFANKIVDKTNRRNQIDIRLEDLRDVMKYPDNYFDFIYARLVLHYLSAQNLQRVLEDFYRILKPGSKIFVVVRSAQNIRNQYVETDPETKLTKLYHYHPDGRLRYVEIRYFHTLKSITHHLIKAKFTLSHIAEYPEQLFIGFDRKVPADKIDHLIEVHATKQAES